MRVAETSGVGNRINTNTMATQNRLELLPRSGIAKIVQKGDFARATANQYLLMMPDVPDTFKGRQFVELLTEQLNERRGNIKLLYGKDAEIAYNGLVLKTFGIKL